MTLGTRKPSAMLLVGLVSLCCLTVLGGVGAKLLIESRASPTARAYADAVIDPDMSPDQKIVVLTQALYRTYRQTGRAAVDPVLFRLRPYLTHDLVPAFLRVEEGAIDSLYVHGKCDNAARTLVYLLEAQGLNAWQFNYNTPSVAHSVVLVELPGGGLALADPMLGVLASYRGSLISPQKAQRLQQAGIDRNAICISFSGPEPVDDFYREFDVAVMSKQGEPQTLEIMITMSPGQIIRLGQDDISGGDVTRAATGRGWYSNWHYIGSKCDRAWQRVMHFPQRTRVTFHLTEPVNPKFITSDIIPAAVDGHRLIYEVEKGAAIHFEDGKAGRDWLSLKSYQDVDFITFEALPEPT